jgi:hypothetical protein
MESGVVTMIELSTVMSDLRRELDIAPDAEVPVRLVADALAHRLVSQSTSPGAPTSPGDTRTSRAT